MKKLLAAMLALVMALSLCSVSWAEETELADGANLKTAIENAADGDIIKLMADATFSEVIKIADGKKITIDLNGKNITSSAYFEVVHGGLTLTGSGTYTTSSPYAIKVVGSADDQGANYSVITVNSGVTVTSTDTRHGYAVIQSPEETDVAGEKYYGAAINFFGKANGAIYTNGRCNKTTGSVTKIDLTGAAITCSSEKTGIYAAGYAEWTLKNTSISAGTALSLKSGTFVIDGGTYTATGEYAVPGTDTSNGAVETGAALSMTSNEGYAKKLDVVVKNGQFVSQNGNAVCEAIPAKASGSGSVAAESYVTLSIENGSFNGDAQKGAVDLRSIGNKKVITGGVFSTSVREYVIADLKYEATNDGEYTYHSTLDNAVAAAGDDGYVDNISVNSNQGTLLVKYNDGTGREVRIYTSMVAPEVPTMTREGYTFKGWLIDEGTTVYADLSTIEFAGDGATLTAVWSANSYYYYPSTTTDSKTDSPKTFDAGVGLYAVTAVLSVTGMAWVGKKRH